MIIVGNFQTETEKQYVVIKGGQLSEEDEREDFARGINIIIGMIAEYRMNHKKRTWRRMDMTKIVIDEERRHT